MSSTRAPFALVTAFTSSPFGGNPAAVVFLDSTSLPLDYVGEIAKNLNQPMMSLVSNTPLPSEDDKILVRSIRFFASNGKEVPICGHATLATARVLFSSPEVQASGAHTIHFKNGTGATLTAVKLDDGFIEIELPSTVPGDVSADELARLKTFIDKAFGRDVVIKNVKTGGKVYEPYVLIELDKSEDLAGSTIDAKQLIGNGYVVNVLTTASPDSDATFVLRMFAPSMIGGTGEDPVCGSAHGLLVPYWYSKLGIAPGQEVKSKQVSSRGGNLRVVWKKEEGRIKLQGQTVILATGELQL
ncbi:hypothetical protein BDZ97DRAFT_1911985 [Flammula alnicola]|nr:hypothetical protein BDZ97DRAFT_1911985 [Flammula alnicola]